MPGHGDSFCKGDGVRQNRLWANDSYQKRLLFGRSIFLALVSDMWPVVALDVSDKSLITSMHEAQDACLAVFSWHGGICFHEMV